MPVRRGGKRRIVLFNILQNKTESNHYEIDCEFKINTDGSISFDLERYDKKKHLIIDPLVYSTYFGGTEDDIIYDIAINDNKDIFVTGETHSNDFTLGQS